MSSPVPQDECPASRSLMRSRLECVLDVWEVTVGVLPAGGTVRVSARVTRVMPDASGPLRAARRAAATKG